MAIPMKERLRTARKAAGFTQKQVAAYIGVTESAYCGYETGKRQPDPAKISSIALLLDVTGDYLLGLVDQPKDYYGVTISDTDPQIERLLANADKLNVEGKQQLIGFSELLVASGKYQKKPLHSGEAE